MPEKSHGLEAEFVEAPAPTDLEEKSPLTIVKKGEQKETQEPVKDSKEHETFIEAVRRKFMKNLPSENIFVTIGEQAADKDPRSFLQKNVDNFIKE